MPKREKYVIFVKKKKQTPDHLFFPVCGILIYDRIAGDSPKLREKHLMRICLTFRSSCISLPGCRTLLDKNASCRKKRGDGAVDWADKQVLLKGKMDSQSKTIASTVQFSCEVNLQEVMWKFSLEGKNKELNNAWSLTELLFWQETKLSVGSCI